MGGAYGEWIDRAPPRSPRTSGGAALPPASPVGQIYPFFEPLKIRETWPPKPFDGFLGNIHEVRWAQNVPPPTDPWKWGGAIGAWILSIAQVDALNPKLREGSLPSSDRPRTLGRGPYSPSAHTKRETER